MNFIRAALAALLIVAPVANALTVRVSLAPNAETSTCGAVFSTGFPSGNCPITGGGNECSTWTCADKGDALEDINEESATELTVVTTGGTNDIGNISYAYQEVTTGDIQITGRIVGSWDGPLENFTGFMGGITEGTADADYFAQVWYANGPGSFGCKSGTTSGTTSEQGTEVSLPYFWGLTYDQSETDIRCWMSSDGNTWTQVGTSRINELTFTAGAGEDSVLAYAGGTSHDPATTVTATIDNLDITSTIDVYTPGTPPLVTERDLAGEVDFETGQIQAQGHQDEDGVYRDGARVSGVSELGSTCTITDITDNDATASVSITNMADCPMPLPAGTAMTLGTISSGMTEMSGRMVRLYGCNGTTCQLWQDGDDTGYQDLTEFSTVGQNVRINTSTYGAWTGTTTGQRWQHFQILNGDTGVSSTNTTARVIEDSFTPPDNLIGSANAVEPLLGDYFLSTWIYFDRDYSLFPGNSNRNKPRMNFRVASGESAFAYNTENYISFSVFLPSNYDHESQTGVNQSVNSVMNIPSNDAADDNLIHIRTVHGTGNVDHWNISYQTPSEVIVDAGQVEVDVWTTWLIRVHPHTGASGILQIWKSDGGCMSAEACDMELVVDRVGAPVTEGLNTSYQINPKHYKYNWHSRPDTIDSNVIWWGFDEIRWGGVVANGTTFADVHPFGLSAP